MSRRCQRPSVSRVWIPLGSQVSTQRPTPGTLLAWDHAVWRLVSVIEVPEVDWTDDEHAARRNGHIGLESVPLAVLLRPTDDDASSIASGRDVHLRVNRCRFHVYPSEHYPVCVQCGEPLPCRDQVNEWQISAAMWEFDRYTTPGICPACGCGFRS